MIFRILAATACVTSVSGAAATSSAHEADRVTPNFEQAIPDIPGKSLVAVVVDYPPGAASIPHIHAKSAFIYTFVVSGRTGSKVNDGPTRTCKARESWSEPPGASHSTSRNASKTGRPACSRSSSSLPTTRT